MRSRTIIDQLEPRQFLTVTAHLYDPSVGMIGAPTQTATHSGDIELPQIAPDGTITVTGTSVDDVITVDRVYSLDADLNDGEVNYANYIGPDGHKIWGQGELEQYADGSFLTDERTERDNYLAEGNTTEAADYQRRIDQGENFLTKFQSGKFLRITLQGVYDYFYEMTDDQAANAKFIVNAGAGKDTITVAKDVPLQASLNGEGGADTLISGKKVARLYGGGGNDRLISRSTKGGTLDGGKGADRYYNLASTSKVNVKARADGDRVSTSDGMVSVTKPGTFGTLSINSAATTKEKKESYLIDGDHGLIDVLS